MSLFSSSARTQTLRTALLGNEHPDVATSLDDLAGVLLKQGRHTEAETVYRECVAMRRKLLGNEHPDVADPLGSLAGMLRDTGRLVEAVSAARRDLIDQNSK